MLLDASQVMNNHEECKRKQLETDEKLTKMQKQIDMIRALLMLENIFYIIYFFTHIHIH
jgi:hypothetical protein